MSKTLHQKYYQQIKQLFDWPGIKADLKAQLNELDCCKEESNQIKAEVFVGTVFGLSPSGKFYTPWAHSHVTSREAYRDEAWYAALTDVAEEYGLYAANSEDDPCDIVIGIARDK